MRRSFAAVLVAAALVATHGEDVAIATPSSPPVSIPGGAGDYQIVTLQNVPAERFAKMLSVIYPRIRFIIDPRSNSVVMRGPAADLKGAGRLKLALDTAAKPDPNATEPPYYNQSVRVFSVDPQLGAQTATAVTAFIQGLPPLPAPSTSPAQSNVNVVVKTGSGYQGISSSPEPPAVVLAPSQSQIIVRADTRTLDIIQSKVLPALAVPPAPKGPSQLFQAYEVMYPIPNPLPASPAPGSPLVVTSSITDLANAVQGIINQSGSTDVRLTPDPSYPRIIVAGSPSGVQTALRMLRSLDKRPAQVDIKAQFYEIDTNAASNIGFQLPTGAIQTTIGEYSPPSGLTSAGVPITATPPPLLSPQKLTHANVSIAAQLNLLWQRGNAKLIATSHVATINGRRTILSVLNNIPFPVTNPGNSAAVPTVTNYQTGTTLEIVPMINADGSISAYLHPVYSTLSGFTVLQAPLISTREAFTTFRLLSGEAAYISGLEETNESDNEQRVPGLGSIPLVGHLFRNRVRQRVTTQLFIVLTASVADMGDLEIPPLEIDPSRPPTARPAAREEPLPTPPYIPSLPPPPPSPTPSPSPRLAGG